MSYEGARRLGCDVAHPLPPRSKRTGYYISALNRSHRPAQADGDGYAPSRRRRNFMAWLPSLKVWAVSDVRYGRSALESRLSALGQFQRYISASSASKFARFCSTRHKSMCSVAISRGEKFFTAAACAECAASIKAASIFRPRPVRYTSVSRRFEAFTTLRNKPKLSSRRAVTATVGSQRPSCWARSCCAMPSVFQSLCSKVYWPIAMRWGEARFSNALAKRRKVVRAS